VTVAVLEGLKVRSEAPVVSTATRGVALRIGPTRKDRIGAVQHRDTRSETAIYSAPSRLRRGLGTRPTGLNVRRMPAVGK
jgi:hypothetical protein